MQSFLTTRLFISIVKVADNLNRSRRLSLRLSLGVDSNPGKPQLDNLKAGKYGSTTSSVTSRTTKGEIR